MNQISRKYRISDDPEHSLVLPDGTTLRRIVALRDIPRCGVEAGNIGGYIQSVDNLNQEGDCWISGNALVYGDACVSGDAVTYI